MHRSPTAHRAAAAAMVLGSLLTAGCSAGSAGGAPTSSVTVSAFPSTPSPVPCPNPEGDACVGALTPGTTYRTTVFAPPISYSVAEQGWSNYEDTPGNFLLVPPGNDLPGVNAGTSDFIGVYTSVAPSRFLKPPRCSTRLVPGIAPTPAAMVAWMNQQSSITLSAPHKAALGGLEGLVTDVAVKPGATLPTCREGTSTFSVFVLFSGRSPSSLDHGVIPDMTMRLYLLGDRGHVLAVELDDIDSAPGTLESLDTTAHRLTFTH